MPSYTYVCENGHEELHNHPYESDPHIVCETCEGTMWKLPPKGVSVYNNPSDTLYKFTEERYADYRARKKKVKKNGKKGSKV